MDILHAILLGIVEGVTEFLPVSSTGHLTIVEKLLGYEIDAPGITAFTAVIQIGAILAAVLYFWKDIVRIATAWCKGIVNATNRDSADYRMGWYVIIGSIPVAIVGLLFKNEIETVLRSMWFVVGGLIVWSIVMFVADRKGTQNRAERDITWKDALIIGCVQCLSLIPGVSRSGATIAAGLFRGIDRVTATRLSFFLGIPALVAAGGLQAVTHASTISHTVGWGATIAGIVTSFVVGYLSIAWLIKFVSHHNFTPFVIYRIALAIVIIGLLTSGVILAQ
ncbi:MAG: undecaprenyl-diphosphate phosphatase [Candidatus Saccharimonas sp.]